MRELENLVRRTAALYAEQTIGAEVIGWELDQGDGKVSAGEESGDSLVDTVEKQLSRYFALHGAGLPPDGLYSRVLHEIERPLIILSLAATGGNQVKAARLLGLNRNTLRKKLRDLRIPAGRDP